MTDIRSRLVQFIDNLGISIRAFEERCSLKRGNISNIAPGGAIGSDKLAKIFDAFPQLNTHWLITGKGNMLVEPVNQNNDRDVIDATYSNKDSIGIPLIPVEAMAGFFTDEVTDYDPNCEHLVIPGVKADFVVPVCGDSMEPKFFSGDLVACQMVSLSDIFFQWGKVYVIDTVQGVLIKKIKRGNNPNHVILISENPEYEPVEIPCSAILHISLVKALVRLS